MNLTTEQLKQLKEPCHQCGGTGKIDCDIPYTNKFKTIDCLSCLGTGKNSITIPMEEKECPKCDYGRIDGYWCEHCNKDGIGTGKLPKYKIRDVIKYKYIQMLPDGANSPMEMTINLKIISINLENKTMEVIEDG